MPESQIVYVLTNPAMPSLVKVGKTTQGDVEQRMSQLYSTGVPYPFECVYAVEVEDCSKVESALHMAFGPNRVNPKREFFDIEAEQAIAILKLLGNKDMTPQINSELNSNISEVEKSSAVNAKKKRPNMNFEEMGIPRGSIITYGADEEIFVEIVSDRKVKYKNEIMSLTKATKLILELDYSVQPARHWIYDGKTLKEIYDDTYSLDDV